MKVLEYKTMVIAQIRYSSKRPLVLNSHKVNYYLKVSKYKCKSFLNICSLALIKIKNPHKGTCQSFPIRGYN